MILITGGPGQDAITLGALAMRNGLSVSITGKSPAALAIGRALLPEANWVLLDLLDLKECQGAISELGPATIFNFAGKSSVASSWETPLDSLDVNVRGTVNLLWATHSEAPTARFWQAGSSEMFRRDIEVVELDSPTHAASPYGQTKIQASAWVRLFREHYGLDAASLIMFNHESPLRAREFVWKHIQSQFVHATGSHISIKLRNPNAAKDWGWAPDFMVAALMTSNMQFGEDLILATGHLTSITEIVAEFCRAYGFDSYDIINDGPPRLNDEHHPVGSIKKTFEVLGWRPLTSLSEAVDQMVKFADFSGEEDENLRQKRAWIESLTSKAKTN